MLKEEKKKTDRARERERVWEMLNLNKYEDS
jgi:hypothetical protein